MKNNTGAIDANHFEYIQNLATDEGGESILARKFDNGKVYTVKLVRKSGFGAARFAARIRDEQAALKLLTKLEVPFVIRLWWSFEDERAMYLVTVSALCDSRAYMELTDVPSCGRIGQMVENCERSSSVKGP